jgi:cytochrome P450
MYSYDALATFGPNLATLEGEAWRRHRRIIAPAFGEVRGLC